MFLCAKLVLLDIAGSSLKEASVHTDTDTDTPVSKSQAYKNRTKIETYILLLLRLNSSPSIPLLPLSSSSGSSTFDNVQFNHSTATAFELHTYCVCRTCIFQFFSFLSESYSQVTQFPQKHFQVEEIRRNVCNIPEDASPKNKSHFF